MIYDIEVLSAGTELTSSIYLRDFTELEESCFWTIIQEFNKQPFIGGVSRV